MSEFSAGLHKIFGGEVNIDVGKVISIVESIVAAAPAIEKGIVTAEPFVEGLVALIQTGGNPSAQDWASLTAKLDANSAIIAQASADAMAELAKPAVAPLPAGASVEPAEEEAGVAPTDDGEKE